MPTWVTGVNPTLNADSAGWNGYTIRQYFAAAVLSNSGLQIARVTFTASSAQALTITNAYIGNGASSGDAYDFESTPVQLTFDSGSASKAISAGQSATSDTVNFSYGSGKNLVVSIYIAGGTSVDDVRTASGLGASYVAYYKVANDAATVDATGYSTGSGIVYAVDLVEFASNYTGTSTTTGAMTATGSVARYPVWSMGVPRNTWSKNIDDFEG